MATVYAATNGDILRWLSTREEELALPDPPNNTAYTLRFDEETNPGVIAAFNQNSNAFSMVGGTLTQSGTPVTINDPGAVYNAFALLPSVIAKLGNGDPLTTTEQKAVLRVLLRGQGLV